MKLNKLTLINPLTVLKIIIVSTFFLIVVVVYFVTTKDMNSRKKEALSHEVINLNNTYKVSMSRFEIVSESITNTVIKTKEVLEILYKAKHAKNDNTLVPLRSKLYEIMKPHFDSLKKV
ncbi:MAG: hypothetical protein KC427_09770, partial [Sulfurovum sp.]|uniref:hypothetical protein n=1 Tax=Sulfurovum sp. TaxID=1969726 RepID=UPI002867F484